MKIKPKTFILAGVVIFVFAGCTPVAEQVVYGTGGTGWKQALKNLDSAPAEERLYIARDLKLYFADEKNITRRFRAVYGLLRVAYAQAKDGYYESAVDICSFLYSALEKDAAGGRILKKAGKQFVNTLGGVLPAAVELRKTENWKFLREYYENLRKQYPVKQNKWRVYTIKEASALNALEKAYEKSSYKDMIKAAKEYRGTKTASLAKKMVLIVRKAKLKTPDIGEKYLIINSEILADVYESQREKIEERINKIGPKTLK